MKISYAITAHNEHEELERLLDQLDENITDNDEVILQLDSSATEQVKSVSKKHLYVKVIEFPLNKDFASFKNNLKSNCTGDWIFQIDADEYLDPWLIQTLPGILEQNDETEVFIVPRINTVDGLTEEHVRKWGWRVNEMGWVNFPDWQTRILKNVPNIFWKNKVHEVLTGQTRYSFFPEDVEFCIIHHKSIQRQETQNSLYNTI